jgi:hypothetical protein
MPRADGSETPSVYLSFTAALAKGEPMRRRIWQIHPDPMWLVLNADGDWLCYDQEEVQIIGYADENFLKLKLEDYLANDWEVLSR